MFHSFVACTTLSILFSFAHAGMADILPSKTQVNPAAVEYVKVLQEMNAEKSIPRVSLIMVDNGGSSDIGSYMTASRLYLGIFLDGEETNLLANYELFNLNKIEKVSYNNFVISIKYSHNNDQLNKETHCVFINIKEALSELTAVAHQGYDAAANNNDGDYYLRASIGIANDHADQKCN